jgi:hypothetical protein
VDCPAGSFCPARAAAPIDCPLGAYCERRAAAPAPRRPPPRLAAHPYASPPAPG